nr:UDP-N-acetylglucosamine 1-carboxyvinyltransferase [uncultured Cellulosilyticum sp.]
MSEIVIQGGRRLEGELHIAGSKNAILPIIAATLLCRSTTYLYNCPRISDVELMIKILKQLGCKIMWDEKVLMIDTSTLDSCDVPADLVNQMRSSIILLGAILGRCKEAKIGMPGGCQLGKRPIDLHLDALRKMQVDISQQEDFIHCKTLNLQGAHINLTLPSVGATENIMLAGACAKGTTTIDNAAREPEIVDLQNFLNACGAKISGAGTKQIIIHGVEALNGTNYRVIPDRIVAGTYLVAGAITRGNVVLNDVYNRHLGATINKLRAIGCNVREEKNKVILTVAKPLKGIVLKTEVYPGFPTDMQSQFVTLLTTCNGISHVKENIFESRFKAANELRKLGAHIIVNEETQIATIHPTPYLKGTEVDATDLRGGAALVLAGLIAEGTTVVKNAHHIQRGYEDIVRDLSILGADVTYK